MVSSEDNVLKEMEKIRDDYNKTSSIELKICRLLLEICTDIKMIKIKIK